jgi:hypothetical protein
VGKARKIRIFEAIKKDESLSDSSLSFKRLLYLF